MSNMISSMLKLMAAFALTGAGRSVIMGLLAWNTWGVIDGAASSSPVSADAVNGFMIGPLGLFTGASIWKRLSLWVLMSAAIPVVTSRLIANVTLGDSNSRNALLLAALVFLDIALELFIVGFNPVSYIWWGLASIALIFFTGYNYAVCNKIDELAR